MEPFYRTILKRSWQFVKKYKFLWPLGFFTAFLGNSGELGFFLDFTNRLNQQPSVWLNFKSYFLTPDLIDIFNIVNQAPLLNKLIILLLFFFCLIFIFLFIWLVIASQGGLINGIKEIEKQGSSSFKLNFKIGAKFFWPVLFLNFITKFISFLIVTVILTPIILLLIAKNSDYSSLIIVLGFLIFLPAVVILNFVCKYAIAYVILQGKNAWTALANGWRLFIANWLVSLEMALILLVINLLVGVIFIVASLIIISPIIVSIMFYQQVLIFSLLMPLAIVLFILLLIAMGIWLATFQYSAWILLFLKLNENKLYSKLERLTMAISPLDR